MKRRLDVLLRLAVAGTAFADGAEITYPYTFKYEGNPQVRPIRATDPDVHVWDGVF